MIDLPHPDRLFGPNIHARRGQHDRHAALPNPDRLDRAQRREALHERKAA